MNAVAPLHEYVAEDPADAARAARQMRMMKRLAERGMELVESVVIEPGQSPTGPARAFVGIARGVRQCIALENHVRDEQRQRCRPAKPPSPAKAARKARIRESIETTIARERDGSDAERLLSDLTERLEDPEFDTEWGDKPIAMVVADICIDLGLPFDGRLWSPEDVGAPPPEIAPHPD